MKRLITIFLLICSLTAYADKWYIATTGSDIDGNGSVTYPWLTLKHACDTVTGANFVGDTIMVGVGTFNMPDEVTVGLGVSIKGAGVTSILNISYVSPGFQYGLNHGGILLASAAENTAGNQSISHLKFDGDSVGTNAIMVKNRGRVKIHDCTFIDFLWNGVTFSNAPNVVTPPTTRAVGNMLYDCIIDNCTDSAGSWRSFGLIGAVGQDSLIIHDNLLYADKRAEGYNGDIFTAGGQGFSRRIKYYNNKSWKPTYDGHTWNFHLEIFNCYGGNEIYNNEFYGGDCAIDITGMYENTKGDDDYSYRIHNNYFEDTPIQTFHGKRCIDIEGELQEDIEIYNNHFKNIAIVLGFGDNTYKPSQTRRVYFNYNIIEKGGWNDATKYITLIDLLNSSGSVLDSIYFDNNVVESDGVTHTAAFKIGIGGTASTLRFRNNILTGHTNGAYMLVNNTGTLDILQVDNNCLYGNSNSNDPLIQAGTITNYTTLNNVKADPLFKSTSNFRLQSTSPAINAGLDVGLTEDFKGHRIPQNGIIDIGAYEYGNYLVTTPSGHLLRNANGKFMIIH